MSYKAILLIISLISTTLYSSENTKTNNELLSIISNSKIKINYFFFMEKNKSFLIKAKDNKNYSIWHYTDNRKWRPIHNAESFDGFDEALKNISNISRNIINKTISFGSVTNATIPNDTLELLKTIEDETIKTQWYFWNKDKEYFLFKELNNSKISIWNYTNNRKWKPLHNAEVFDGFDKALKTLKDVKFDGDSLSIGNFILSDNNGSTYNKDALILKVNNSIYSEKSLYAIRTNPQYKYNYSVDCNNDGINEADNLKGDYICKYDKYGFYEVAINGVYPSKVGDYAHQWYENTRILEIKQWGNIKWENMKLAFSSTPNMTMSAKDIPNLSETNDTAYMFNYSNFNQDISKWDVSSIVDMRGMFSSSKFNQDISNWDVSNVVNIGEMFSSSKFNQDISNWDVSSAVNMKWMFRY